MTCASCGRENRDGARFCDDCGAPLAARCPACGADARPDARFCDACGAALAGRSAEAAVARKVVTIVFADLIGSVSLHERLDPESVSGLMDRYHRAVRAPVEAHGGTVVQLLGDGVMCAFGVPRVAEDDAIRAVRAGVAMQQAFREFARAESAVADRLGLRVAINTGEVVVSDDYAAGIGDPLNVAARLQQEARDGDVLVSASTERLVGQRVTLAPVGTFALKGRSETVAAFRVVSLERPAGAPALPFVGREEELRRVAAAFDAAVAAPAARLAVVLGSPGLGKSRLVAELTRRLGERATVLSAQCDAAGGPTFAPLAEAFRDHLHIEAGAEADAVRAALEAVLRGDESERARIAGGIGALLAGTPASPEETFFVVRRLLGALAAERPVVLAIDDLQWAEPLLLDLTEHLVQWGAGLPLLVLGAARPELRDRRSSLTSAGGLVADVVTLAGLDAGAAARLAASVVGAEALPAAIAGRVLATSEGNPLFVGELVRMLVNEGALKQEGDRWTASAAVAGLEMPPTIQALLAARIERLRPEDRLVLERAAIVGRHFSRGAVAHLLPREARAELDDRLESLRRSELLEPDAGWLLGEPVLRFHHVLIRDAAYRRVLRNTRAELHARFAEWLEQRAAGSVEHEEMIGWHLEQAHRHLRELGPLDATGLALGERAARHLAAAGRRALARDDLRQAAGLLGRALDALEPADPARAELALDWCEALLGSGEVGSAAQALAELDRFTAGSERLRAWHTCFAGQLAVLTDSQALRSSADAVELAAAALTAAGDAAGEAKAHSVHATALARLGKVGACEAALDHALAAARRAGDRRRANAVLAGAPEAALWGPSPVTRASGRCLDVVRVLRITQGAPAVEGVALRCQAVLETLRGRGEAARRLIAASRQLVEELGVTQRLLEGDVFAGLVELLEGDAPAAERRLRPAYEGLREHGLDIDAAQAAALLGRALLAQGRAGEAEALSHESEALAGDDLKAAIAWRGVRAEALAQRGEAAAAVELARAAVSIAEATDALLDHADARHALAAALRAAGRDADAEAEARRAVELWEAKGATLLVERARQAVAPAAPLSGAVPSAAPAGALRLENAAARAQRRFERAWVEHRWDEVLASYRPDVQMDDRRSVVGLELRGESFFANVRLLFDVPESRWEGDLLATRGERLALFRYRFCAGRSGRIEAPQLSLVERDAEGRMASITAFDVDAVQAAVAELEARYAAGETPGCARVADGMRRFSEAFARRDWSALAARCAPDLVVHDHRRLGWESLRGPAAYVAALRGLVELAPDTRLRLDHVTRIERGYLVVTVWEGTREGGAFEEPSLMVAELDAAGRICRFDQYDFASEAQAWRRLDEIAGSEPAPEPGSEAPERGLAGSVRLSIPRNAADQTFERWRSAFVSRDWAALAALCAPDMLYEDRRPMALVRGGREVFLESSRLLAEVPGPRITRTVLATAGERLALASLLWQGDGFEAELLEVEEVDDTGRMLALVVFDPGDRCGAVVELRERFLRTHDAPRSLVELARALDDHDLERARAVVDPEFVFHDRRRTSVGRIEGVDGYLASLAGMFEQTPDGRNDTLYYVEVLQHGTLSVARTFGTLAMGGAFESIYVRLQSYREGRHVGMELFELEDLELARARFEELRPPDPLRIPENAAVRAMTRFAAVATAREFDAMESMFSPSLRWEDRRPLLRDAGGRDEFLRSVRGAFATGVRPEATTLATSGDRLALGRIRFLRYEGGTLLDEVDGLQVAEVDVGGRIVALVTFDLAERRAASLEMFERYVSGEGARFLPPPGIEALRAMNEQDLEQLTSTLPDDFVLIDHRRAGLGRLEGADAFVASLRALFEQAPDLTIETLYDVAADERGALSVARVYGTLARGGGDFESIYARLFVFRGGRPARMELFELADLSLARARFVALPSEQLSIPANEAVRTFERGAEAFRADDWAAWRALAAPDFLFEDRRGHARLRGDIELWIRNLEVVRSWPGLRARVQLLATRGERVALDLLTYGGGQDGGRFEGELLRLLEIDASGRLCALVHFDSRDRRAAFAETERRFEAGEAAGLEGVAAIGALRRAFEEKDWDAVRDCLAPDAVVADQRALRLGAFLGELARDEWIETLRGLAELAPETSVETVHLLAWNRLGYLSLVRQVGTQRDGGSFENVYLGLFATDGARVRRFETFEVGDAERALARFHELCGEPGPDVGTHP